MAVSLRSIGGHSSLYVGHDLVGWYATESVMHAHLPSCYRASLPWAGIKWYSLVIWARVCVNNFPSIVTWQGRWPGVKLDQWPLDCKSNIQTIVWPPVTHILNDDGYWILWLSFFKERDERIDGETFSVSSPKHGICCRLNWNWCVHSRDIRRFSVFCIAYELKNSIKDCVLIVWMDCTTNVFCILLL